MLRETDTHSTATDKSLNITTQTSEQEVKTMDSQQTATTEPELKNSDSNPSKTPETSSAFSEKAPTENKNETKTKKTQKRKRVNKITISRDEEALAAIDADMDALKASHVKIEMSDKQVIERKIDKILELKASGVGYESIHKLFKEKLELQITTQTFIYYVQSILNKDKPKRDPKTVKISIPKEFAGKIEKLVGSLETGFIVSCLAFKDGEYKGRLDIGDVPNLIIDLGETRTKKAETQN